MAIKTALLVAPVGEMAGVGRHVVDLVETGVPGWQLRVLAPPGDLASYLPDEVLISGDFGPQFGVPASVRTLRRVVRALQPKVVHSHLAWADLVTSMALLSVPHVSTEHGIAGDSELYASSRLDAVVTNVLHRIRMRRMAATICVSHATKAELQCRWHPPRSMPLVVIPNGVDRVDTGGNVTAPKVAREEVTVGFLGRFAPEKRPELMLRSFALVKQQLQNVTLSMAGAGQLQGELEQLVDALGLSDSVQFAGWVDTGEWLTGVDVMCTTSVWENCSYAILETIANGVGVVAAPVGGNGELLPAHALVDPVNPELFAAAVVDQCLNPGRRPSLPAGYPTRTDMAVELADVYAQVAR